MRSFTSVVIVFLVIAAPARAQLSAEEAKAKLAEKETQRQAERAKVVTITAGELADLRTKVATLEAQLKALQAQGGAGGAKPVAKRPPDQIDIGMTKDEVIA